MIVTQERVISLTYELRVDSQDGKLIETVSEDAPLTFLYGSGKLLPKFEDNIKELGQGDEFEFNLKCADAYGEFNENAVVSVPKNVFEVNGVIDNDLVKLGNSIPMMDKSGNRLSGTVIEITADSIRMDFNHPLAGNDLYFKGKVSEVREATEEELAQGLDHACGCGGGCSCDSGSGDGCC